MRRAEFSDLIDPARLARGVLALDLSSSTGWAYATGAAATVWPTSKPYSDHALVPPDPRPAAVRFGTVELGRDSHGARFERLSDWLREARPPGLVVIEQAIPAKFSRSDAATMIAQGLRAVVHGYASAKGVEIRECPIVSAKSWFGSPMTRDKAPMMATARLVGWDVKTDHEADALAILDLTLARAAMAAKMRRMAA